MAQLTPQFFATILKIEGGFQDHPADSGNYCGGQLIGTKYGMSAVAVSAWIGRCPTRDEMMGLSEAQAFSFYAWYFDRYNLFGIENQALFELVANNAMGSPANSAKVVQRILKQMGYNVAVDGVYGPQTIGALNAAWSKYGPQFYNMIRDQWVEYLISLDRPEFIDGWLYRMNTFFPPIATTASNIGIFLMLMYGGWLFYNRNKL